jgi:hypothetical protein
MSRKIWIRQDNKNSTHQDTKVSNIKTSKLLHPQPISKQRKASKNQQIQRFDPKANMRHIQQDQTRVEQPL